MNLRHVAALALVGWCLMASPVLAADHCEFVRRDEGKGIVYVCHGRDRIRYLVEGVFFHGKGYWVEVKPASKNVPFTVDMGRPDGSGEPYKTWAECDSAIKNHLSCDGLDCYPTVCTFHDIPVLSDYPEDEGEKWDDDSRR